MIHSEVDVHLYPNYNKLVNDTSEPLPGLMVCT